MWFLVVASIMLCGSFSATRLTAHQLGPLTAEADPKRTFELPNNLNQLSQ